MADQIRDLPTASELMSDEDIVELTRIFSLSAPIRIPKEKLDPNYVYRFINKRNSNVFQRRRGVGWKPVTLAELETLTIKPHTAEDLHIGTHTDADGHVVIGDDLVFAKLPKRYAEAIRAHHQKANANKLKSGRKKFHEAGLLAGVQTTERSGGS